MARQGLTLVFSLTSLLLLTLATGLVVSDEVDVEPDETEIEEEIRMAKITKTCEEAMEERAVKNMKQCKCEIAQQQQQRHPFF